MFGDNYFKTRERLADLAARVIELADRTGADQSPLTDDGIVHGLISPFLFVACGESQSGKSMLLNGIFGQEVCQISNGGRPPKVRWYKHAKKSANKEVTPLVEECYRPVDFLEHFNLMDTPGTDVSIGDLGNLECQKITERFLPASDLVFWVLPVSNPWGASLWKFFSAQSDAILKKSVIILQQTDLKDEGDIEIILGHVRDLAQQRLGTVPPIFPVSGLWSMRAKRSNPVDAQLWHDSGYPALERHIVELVEHSPARQRMLLDIRKSLAEVLRSIEQAVEHRAHLLEGNEQFLRDLESEVDAERRRYSSDFSLKFVEMQMIFAGKNKEVKRHVRRKLGVFSTLKSLLVAENTSKVIESWLIDSIESSVAAQADQDAGHLVEACHQHWETVRPRVFKKLSISLSDFDDEADGFVDIRREFTKRMGVSARQAVLDMRVRKALNPLIIARREHLKNWLYLVLVFLMGAGVTGALRVGGEVGVPMAFLGVSVLSLLIFTVRVRVSAKQITRFLGRRLEDERISFSLALERDYQEGIRSFYSNYGTLLASVRRHILLAQQEHQPNLEQRNRLFLELMILEQEL